MKLNILEYKALQQTKKPKMIEYTKLSRKSLYGLKNGLYGHIMYLLPTWELWLMLIFALSGCSTVKYVPTQTKEVINHVDSLRIRDSVVVIPVERYVDIVPVYDTLILETSVASSTAYVDTTVHKLVGTIENKKGVEYRYVYRDRVVTQVDSVYVEIPCTVEVTKTVTPKWAWYTLIFSILTVVGIILKTVSHFKPF